MREVQPLHLLVITADAADGQQIKALLAQVSQADIDVQTCDTPVRECITLRQDHYDLLLLDLSLGQVADVAALRPELPVVVIGDSDDTAISRDALHQGAQDVLLLDGLSGRRLLRVIHSAVARKAAEVRARETERLALSVINALHAQIALIDSEGTIIAVNYAWRKFGADNGADPASIGVGGNYLEVCRQASGPWSEEAPLFYVGIREVLTGQRDEFHMEYPCHSPDQKRWFIARVTRFMLQDGRACAVISHENITERKLAEIALDQKRKLADTLREVTASLNNALHSDQVLTQILAGVWRIIPYDAAYVLLVEGATVRVGAVRGYTPSEAYRLRARRWPLNHPALSHMLRGTNSFERSLRFEDLHTDPNTHSHHLTALNWVRASLSVPIQGHGQTIGFLTLESSRPYAFSLAQAEVLHQFAEHAALAVQNAQVYDSIQRTNTEMSAMLHAMSVLFTPFGAINDIQRTGQQIVDAVEKAFGHVDCGLILIDSRTNTLVRVARTGGSHVRTQVPLSMDGPGLVAESFRRGEVIYAPDVRLNPFYAANESSTLSELVIPLVTINGVVGLLDLQSQQADAFSLRDQSLLKAFAERVAVAIENALLYDRLLRHADDLEHQVITRTLEVRQVKDKVEAILNSATDALVLLDSQMRVLNANPAFDALFGFQRDEAFLRPLGELLADHSRAMLTAVFNQILSEGSQQQVELNARRADGSLFPLAVSLALMPYTSGGQQEVVCTLHDITQYRRLEDSLRQSLERERDLNTLKTRFVSIASHEFRTPLTVINSASSLLLNYWERLGEERVAQKLHSIQEQVAHMSHLIDDVLILGRAESGRLSFMPEPVNLKQVCRRMTDQWRESVLSAHVLDYQCSAQVETVPLDLSLVTHIMNNLISNAAKYSPKGSTVHLHVSEDSDWLDIRVRDEGIGIPEADQAKLFESFHRASNAHDIPGTGLGLVIALRAAQMHGGSLRFESVEGQGTTFIVRLPKAPPEAAYADGVAVDESAHEIMVDDRPHKSTVNAS